MQRLFLFLTTLLCSLAQESDYSSLKIVLPRVLNDYAGANGLKHSQALFGTPSYGGDKKIVGELVYVTPGNLNGCSEYQEQVPKVDKGTHLIFLVDRGDCDFVDKIRIAQKNGAVAVLIADNICQCDQTNNWVNDPSKGKTVQLKETCAALGRKAAIDNRIPITQTCEQTLPFMADDGTGYDVRIPSFLIDYVDAQPLKDCISRSNGDQKTDFESGTLTASCTTGTKVVVALEWDLPAHDGEVDWQLWSSSDSEGVFKKAFAATAKKLENAKFTPHYFIWDGAKWGCTIGGICATQCTLGGYYCNPDPDRNLFSGVSGKDVVDENLRELCVWDQAVSKSNPGLWWDYVTTFATDCHPGETPSPDKFNIACSENVHKKIGLDFTITKKCVDDSWDSEKTKNIKLDKELRDRTNLKILTLPTAIVNDVILRGGVTPSNVLGSICAGYKPSDLPSLCTCVERVSPANVLDCINSPCQENQQYCQQKSMCYSPEEYQTKCSPMCGDQEFCPSLGQCVPQGATCPVCDKQVPSYCTILKKCVKSMTECRYSDDDIPKPNGSVDGKQVFLIVLVVVCIAGCAAYAFWRRQKAKLHEDVRAILNSYIALEESEDSNERPSRTRRNQVEPTSGGNNSQSSVSGQDAATYI